MSDESMSAFDRAFATPATGDPLVTPEQEKELNVDSDSAFDRAWEAATVESSNDEEFKTEDETFFDRVFAEPYQRGIQKMTGIIERTAATYGSSDEDLRRAMQDPEALRQMNNQQTNLSSILFQTATLPISMAFDSASGAVLYGAEKGVAMLPNEVKEGALEEFNALMKTPGGQLALNAAGQGLEAWEAFEESNPNEAANLVAALDLGFGRFSSKLAPDYKPMKLVDVGGRKELSPLAGDDANIYKMLFEGPKKTPEQTKLTTGPQGLSGKQEQLASPEQLELIDLAKKAGVSGNKTLQENFNSLNDFYNGLDDKLMKLLARNEKKINWPEIDKNLMANVKSQFDNLIESNPKLMDNKGAREEIANLFKEFDSILLEQGGTLQGLKVARSMFDERLKRMGYNLDGTKLNTASLAAMAVRRAVNQTVFDVVPESSELLTKMSKLIPTIGSLGAKAAEEAPTRLGRFLAATGLSNMAGSTGLSMALNSAYVLGAGAAMAPVFFVKNQLKRPSPAKGIAKIAYVKRDVFKEIKKAINAVKDPIKKQALINDSRAIYTYLNAAFKQVEEEMRAEEKEAANG